MHKLTAKQRQQRLHNILSEARQQAAKQHGIAESVPVNPSTTLIALKKRTIQ